MLWMAGCSQPEPAGTLPAPSPSPPKKVLIQPYGDFSPALADTVKAAIENNYGFDVRIAPPIDLPKAAFTQVKSPRYRGDSLIAMQWRAKPADMSFVLGLTNKDISTTKRGPDGLPKEPAWKYQDWGVLGLGYRPGGSCVVSTFRMGPAGTARFMDRLSKVCLHELGHNLGLPHCTNDPKCVMRDAAETVKTVDQVDAKLCGRCSMAVGQGRCSLPISASFSPSKLKRIH